MSNNELLLSLKLLCYRANAIRLRYETVTTYFSEKNGCELDRCKCG